MSTHLYTLRHPKITFDETKLREISKTSLCGRITYAKTSLEYLPKKGDCLTSLYFLFKRALNLDNLFSFFPLYCIGDMPKMLTRVHQWQILDIDSTEELQAGDLIFASESQKKQINHVAVVITANEIFHCSKKLGTAQIVTYHEFFKDHHQTLNKEDALCFRDPKKANILNEITLSPLERARSRMSSESLVITPSPSPSASPYPYS